MTIDDDALGVSMNGDRFFTGKYECVWFDDKNQLKSGRFAEDALKKAN